MLTFGKRASDVKGWLFVIAIALICVAGGYLLRLAIDVLIHGQVPFVTFYPAVMAASLIAGIRSGILAVIVSTPVAVMAFEAYPVITTVVWLVLATVVAVGCGLAHELRIRLRHERDELVRAKHKLELVIREQTHRAKNTFAILNALAQQSAQGALNIEEFRDRLIARIRALSSAYNLMSAVEGDNPVDLAQLTAAVLAPFSDTYAARLAVSPGPVASLAPSVTIPIALCLHELATNAVKYGALSSPEGRVNVSWSEATPGVIVLKWIESGGPRVELPRSSGFGSRLINAALNGVPGGSAILKFHEQGVICDLAFSKQ